MPAAGRDYSYQLLLIGDATVGKSMLLLRFTDAAYTESYISTSGLDVKSSILELDGESMHLHLYDLSGVERFRCLHSSYYRIAHGIIIVYDVTNQESFSNVKGWLREIDEYAPDGVNKLLVGNKCDLASEKVVRYDEARKLADSFGIQFMETSAKTSHNVKPAFQALVKEIKQRLDSQPKAAPRGGNVLPSGQALVTRPRVASKWLLCATSAGLFAGLGLVLSSRQRQAGAALLLVTGIGAVSLQVLFFAAHFRGRQVAHAL